MTSSTSAKKARPTKGLAAPWEAPKSLDARTLAPESTAPLPVDPFVIFHHVAPNAAPVKYDTVAAPEIKGGFVHFTDTRGIEHWLSGSLTIKRDPSRA